MSDAAHYVIPPSPPPDALAELDDAAHRLDELKLRAAVLTIDMDEQTRSLRIELDDGAGPRRLTATQLFDALGAP